MKKKIGGGISFLETVSNIGLLILFGFGFFHILYQPKLIETNNNLEIRNIYTNRKIEDIHTIVDNIKMPEINIFNKQDEKINKIKIQQNMYVDDSIDDDIDNIDDPDDYR